MIQSRNRGAAAVLLGLTLAVSTPVSARDAACTFGEGPIFNVPVSRREMKPQDKNSAHTPAYDMNIHIEGGGVHSVLVDTGSTGIVVARAGVPKSLWEQTTRNGVMSYSSDGLNLVGRYVKQRVRLGATTQDKQLKQDTAPITAPIDILLIACACALTTQDGSTASAGEATLKDFQSCSTLNGKSTVVGEKTVVFSACKDSKRTSMMGVGFARGGGSSANNPFLQLEAVQKGLVHAGYVIKEKEIQLGLNTQNTAGFQFAPLEPNPLFSTESAPVREWLEPQASVRFDQDGSSLRGSVLMDTGIDYMMLTMPANEQLKQFVSQEHGAPYVPDGTRMTLTFPADGKPLLTYSFTLGKDPRAPQAVSWRGAQGSAHHINTGRNLLTVADYAYDARCGQLGFHPRP